MRGRGGGSRGVSMSISVRRSPNKLLRSNSKFNLRPPVHIHVFKYIIIPLGEKSIGPGGSTVPGGREQCNPAGAPEVKIYQTLAVFEIAQIFFPADSYIYIPRSVPRTQPSTCI